MSMKTFTLTLTLTHVDGGTFDGASIKSWDWQAIVGGDDPDIAVTCESARKLRSTPKSHIDHLTH
jgi:hypothetical protein